ncbi:MAG: hypothetical protein J3K34DRAFT_446096 [Monoraphidium minutum]|nr:MAG: hypothetical protein J3K34DRAFT_446096 [Monoraphidium minutum]
MRCGPDMQVYSRAMQSAAVLDQVLSDVLAAGGGAPDAPAPSQSGVRGAPAAACAVCGKGRDQGKLKVCTGCGAVHYCSAACQKEDWPSHRRACKARASQAAAQQAQAASPRPPPAAAAAAA